MIACHPIVEVSNGQTSLKMTMQSDDLTSLDVLVAFTDC